MTRRPKADFLSAFAQSLAAARSGSRDALGEVFESCRRWLLTVAARELFHDRAAKTTAADCVQDTFLEAQRDFRRFQGTRRGELLNWLRRILLHNLSDVRRRFSTRTRDCTLERSLGDVRGSYSIVCNEPPPFEAVVAAELANEVRSALAHLPGDYRTVLRLRHEEGRSFAEIARLMRKPSEEAARKLCERAARTLRTAVREDVSPHP